eukprot:gene10991-13466_t
MSATTTTTTTPPTTTVLNKTPITLIKWCKELSVLGYAVNNILYLLNTSTLKSYSIDNSDQHKGLIRSIEFSYNRKYLLTSSLDKSIKIWSLESVNTADNNTNIKCLKTLNTNKKIISSIFTGNDESVLVSDKCGDVFTYSLVDDSKNKSLSNAKENKLTKQDERENDENLSFGHYSSIVDLKLSKCFNYLFSADRDEKIRISKYPNTFDIERFCLGHSKYITQMVIISNKPELLVSGSGDGHVILWNWKSGKILQSINFNEKVGLGSITIPNCFDEDTQNLYISIEDQPLVYVYHFDGEKNEFSEVKKIQTPANVLDIGLVSSSSVLVSLATPNKDSKYVVLVNGNDGEVKESELSELINGSVVVADSKSENASSLKQLLAQIEKKQYRKHISYTKNPNASNKKEGDEEMEEDGDEGGLDPDMIAEANDEPATEETADPKKENRPLKLRKMTVAGAKEQQKEVDSK